MLRTILSNGKKFTSNRYRKKRRMKRMNDSDEWLFLLFDINENELSSIIGIIVVKILFIGKSPQLGNWSLLVKILSIP